MCWYCVVWSNSNRNTQSQLLKCSAIEVEGFYGETKMCRWQVLMFWALTDFSLSRVQSSGHNQEEVMTTEEPYELHLNYTYPLKAEPYTHMHALDVHSEQRVFMYCRQTGALSAGVTEGLLGPLSKTQRMCKCDCVCVFQYVCVLADKKWGSQLAGVTSGPGCSSCVRHTPTNALTHRRKKSYFQISSCKTVCDAAHFNKITVFYS